ncbi:MAG: glycine oxidase ThiO [Candidatus Eremiobacteraeota bacterium]|nr:glycine oxidase ThiO [Candidatus Eremiobacteraeota bacterium]
MSVEDSGDAIVVGAGLIGLAIAFELAERGAAVRVYDRGEPGRAASWAGAGMLAPYAEEFDDESLLQLCEASLAGYPAFVERVRVKGDVDPHLHLNGIVHAAFDSATAGHLQRRLDGLRSRGVVCHLLDRVQTLAAEPWLGTDVVSALLVQGEGCVDNRRLGRALIAACRRYDVSIAKVTTLSVECDSRRTLGVRSELGFAAAGAVINACGAWAGQVGGIPQSALPPVVPVKGQMFALEAPVDFVRHATWMPGAYVVPRDDGRLLIGATAERGRADIRVTASGLHQLLQAALRASPALGEFTISETWAGLRPGTPDGRPFIGPTSIDRLFVATGHYRNGILLAPVTAGLIADFVEGRNPPLAPFTLDRAARFPPPQAGVESTQREGLSL